MKFQICRKSTFAPTKTHIIEIIGNRNPQITYSNIYHCDSLVSILLTLNNNEGGYVNTVEVIDRHMNFFVLAKKDIITIHCVDEPYIIKEGNKAFFLDNGISYSIVRSIQDNAAIMCSDLSEICEVLNGKGDFIMAISEEDGKFATTKGPTIIRKDTLGSIGTIKSIYGG